MTDFENFVMKQNEKCSAYWEILFSDYLEELFEDDRYDYYNKTNNEKDQNIEWKDVSKVYWWILKELAESQLKSK